MADSVVLNAIGSCAYYLHDYVDFGTVLLPRLLALLAADSAVMQRRAAVLCGTWVVVRMSADVRPTVYRSVVA